MLNNLCSEILGDLNRFGAVETRKEKIKREKRHLKQLAKEAVKTGHLEPTVRAFRFSEHETLSGQGYRKVIYLKSGSKVVLKPKTHTAVSYHTTGSVQWGTGEGKLIK